MEIVKTTGKRQAYSPAKLRRSLRRAGASLALANDIIEQIPLESITTTQDIHNYAFAQLRMHHRPVAARYNIKSALLRLGPTGYPFEQFVGEIFRELGYTVTTNQILPGRCITHEVDVVAENDERKIFMECKYHGQKGLRSNVQVALYIKARFDDIKDSLKHATAGKKVQGLVVTNTEFSTDAQKYVRCIAGLGLIAWRKPRGFSLAELIDRTGLHPISALTTLSHKQKDQLMRSGTVLCRDLAHSDDALMSIGVTGKKKDRVMREAKAVCTLASTLEAP